MLTTGNLPRDQADAARHETVVCAELAHDLAQPLTVIKGCSQLLLRQVERSETVESVLLRPMLANIIRSAAHMDELLHELIDTARLHTGQLLDLRCSAVDLVALVRQQVEAYQETTVQHRLRLLCAEPSLLGQWDRVRLTRVVSNLLSNAIQYSPAGGEIVVSLGHNVTPDGHWVRLRVRDVGLGIPAAELPNVFDEFYRASNVRAQIPGTGLGLAGAKQIVEQHGGRISVASLEGEGTTVSVELPVAAAAVPHGGACAMAPNTAFELHLTAGEAALLGEVLRADLADLREEVYKTENYEWRQELKQREALLAEVLDRLIAPLPA